MGDHLPAGTQSSGEIEGGEVPTAGDLAGAAVRDTGPIASDSLSQKGGSPAIDVGEQASENGAKVGDEFGGARRVAGGILFASNGKALAGHCPGEPNDDDEQGEGRDRTLTCHAADDDGPVHASEPPNHAADVIEIAARNGSETAGAPHEMVRCGEGMPEDCTGAMPTNGAGQAVQLTIAESPRGTPPTPALAPEAITADLLARDPGEEPPVATPLAIHCFGHFRVLHAGEHLAPQHHAKAWELLQLLAAHPPRSLAKDRLWAALWPDPDGWPTRNVFNTIVGRLRQELIGQVPDLPREVVQKTRVGDCWLDPDLVTVDVHRWLAIVKREPKLPLLEALGEYRLARALYRPALLEGASYEWLALRDDGLTLAEDYTERWSDYRLRLARRCVREGRPDLAVPLYRGIVNELPREEACVRELFRCYGQTGDLPGLERQMRALEAVVRKGYGDELDPHRVPSDDQPEAETRKVYSEVKALLQAGLAESASASDK